MDVLALLEAKGYTLTHSSGCEYKMPCINAWQHDGGTDDNPSFYVNVEKKVAYCQTCGYSLSEVGFTQWLLGDDIDDFTIKAMTLKSSIKKAQCADLFLQESEEFTMMPPSTPWIEDYRGINGEFLSMLGARYCKVGRYENRIILPIYVNHRLRGFDSRALGDEKPKYLRSKGFDAVNEGLYPLDFVTEMQPSYVILCEGIFDSLKANSLGFPALCIFGTQFSMQKLALVLGTGAQEIVLMLDNDEAGIKATNKIAAMLKEWMPTYIACRDLMVDGKDLGDMTATEINYSIEHKEKVK